MTVTRTVMRSCRQCGASFSADVYAREPRGNFCSKRCARLSKPVVSLADRFSAKTHPEPNSGCWLWMGALAKTGYGVIGLGTRQDGVDLAHRVSYRLHRGEIPIGLDLDHLCRNRACVNPDHLEAVTRRVNWERGMHPIAVAWREAAS